MVCKQICCLPNLSEALISYKTFPGLFILLSLHWFQFHHRLFLCCSFVFASQPLCFMLLLKTAQLLAKSRVFSSLCYLHSIWKYQIFLQTLSSMSIPDLYNSALLIRFHLSLKPPLPSVCQLPFDEQDAFHGFNQQPHVVDSPILSSSPFSTLHSRLQSITVTYLANCLLNVNMSKNDINMGGGHLPSLS